ncbi:MAG: fructosamine kinase family protein [Moorea sp. SIO3C2]|nr:fructosamine kinase family protein [Moorena sp. SIO3C2]
MWKEIADQISQVTGETFEIKQRQSVGGGCINQGYALVGKTNKYFVKLNSASQVYMFEAEALGLKQMVATQTIRIPKPICYGTAVDCSYIVLEWLDLGGGNSTESWVKMGHQLAAMHQAATPQPQDKSKVGRLNVEGWQVGMLNVEGFQDNLEPPNLEPPNLQPPNLEPPNLEPPNLQPPNLQPLAEMGKFGWNQNNTIGSTPQVNQWMSDWVEFFVEYRLGYQFQLARRRSGRFPKQDQLLAVVPKLLDHQPQPSLVHGDLWGGNAAITMAGEPVIFDPATYVGDREVDIAMTELFGGFPAAFYRGYNEVWPLDQGYKQRKKLYNLYHILNHFNLFGSGYESQANRMIDQILKD